METLFDSDFTKKKFSSNLTTNRLGIYRDIQLRKFLNKQNYRTSGIKLYKNHQTEFLHKIL